jgi:heptosyltransferase-2
LNIANRQRILIVKVGAIGDVIMALPMVTEIRRSHPEAKISWLCGRIPGDLLKLVPDIDELIEIDETQLLRGTFLARMAVLIGVWWKLLGHSFDLICVGHSDPRYRYLALTCRAGTRRSFADSHALIPGRHHTFEYVRLISGKDGPDANGFVSQPALKLSAPTDIIGRAAGVPLVILAPGGAQNVMRTDALRRWPLEHYATLAKNLIARGMKVAIVGAQSDSYVRHAFLHIDVVDLIGRTDLSSLISTIAAADMVVSHDSSAGHIACLTGTSQIGLFGPTMMAEKLFPRENSVGLWGGEHLACRPCYDGKNYHRCPSNLCMQDISVAKVTGLVLEKLGGTVPAP